MRGCVNACTPRACGARDIRTRVIRPPCMSCELPHHAAHARHADSVRSEVGGLRSPLPVVTCVPRIADPVQRVRRERTVWKQVRSGCCVRVESPAHVIELVMGAVGLPTMPTMHA